MSAEERQLTRSCELYFHTCSGTVGWPDAVVCECECHQYKTWEQFIDVHTYALLNFLFVHNAPKEALDYRLTKAWLKARHPRSTWYAPWMVHRVYCVSSLEETSP